MRITLAIVFAAVASAGTALAADPPVADRSEAAVPAVVIAPAGQGASISVDVARPGHTIPPTLWGIFFEDINLSADGGIYPELVRNRSFEDGPTEAAFWSVAAADDAGVEIAIDSSRPLNPLNRSSLSWKMTEASGPARLINEGYYGMALVAGDEYRLSLAARSSGFSGPLSVTLESQSGQPLAEGKIEGISERWQTFAIDLRATATDPQARLSLGRAGAGRLWLDMVSLMPKKTWKDHGLRPDLCEMLVQLRPSFFRFPGGCWVEGDDMAHMYQWKRTIGDVAHRTPLWNIWQYNATHGLGYHEYLQLAEDLGAEPLFCINCGMSHKEVVPLDQMGSWVQDALDAIEYANGPVDSVWGSLRAKNGHPEPFNLKYLEIGNENGGPAYNERWALFYKAIKAKHPELQLIANVWGGYPTEQMPEIVDEHYYNTPDFFMQQATKYDRYDRTGPKVFVGEYAVTRDGGLGNLRAAVGEAAFMTGLERNSDVVIMAAYAPLFCNANHKRWPVNLINFDGQRAFGLPGYYVQKLFSQHRGDLVLPVQAASPRLEVAGRAGAIGVGTWATQAEFKDIRVTDSDGQVLFASNFEQDLAGWKTSSGQWQVAEGVLRQTSGEVDVRAVVGDRKWRDYTLSLKARKLGGAEGFLILFQNDGTDRKCWWNLGGWGNREHGLEVPGLEAEHVPGRIETDRWYEIRVELEGSHIRCYLDGELVHDAVQGAAATLFASASLVRDSGEVILKVVNAAEIEQSVAVDLKGCDRAVATEAIVLTSASPTDENTLDEPDKVAPRVLEVKIEGPHFQHPFPANSVTILRFTTRE